MCANLLRTMCWGISLLGILQLSSSMSFEVASLLEEQISQYSEALNGNFKLIWRVNRPRRRVDMELCQNVGSIEGERPRLFGMGFGPQGHTENADVVVAWRMPENIHWTIADASTDKRGFFIDDAKRNIEGASVRENDDSWTCLRFSRDFDTCDPRDVVLDTGTIYILFFTSLEQDPHWVLKNSKLNDLNWGMRPLQLLKTPYAVPTVPTESDIYDVRVDSVAVPNKDTTYWCKTMRMPDMPQKMHIIGFEGLISPQSEGIVHHLEVFHCETPPHKKLRNYDAPCNSETKPMGLTSCRKVLGAWAMGAKGLMYPPEAGFPIGGEGFSPYLVIEIHYNNPELKNGLVDSSGLRFYLTKQLRRYDVGIMELGLNYDPKNSIPPGVKDFQLAGFCTAGCTKQALPKHGITVFASQLHTHSTGAQVATYHVRGGKRLPDMNADHHYSPHYQEIRYLQRFVRVLPGDDLINVCTFDTRQRTNVTFGGISIQNEMCLNYIYYYPSTSLELCKSIASVDTMRRFFQHAAATEEIRLPRPKKGYTSDEDIQKALDALPWTSETTRRLQDIYLHGPIHMSCNSSAGHEFPGNWENQKPPKVLPLKDKNVRNKCQSEPDF